MKNTGADPNGLTRSTIALAMRPARGSAKRAVDDEPPPFLGTWNRVYAAVLIYLFVLIVILVIATRRLTEW